jgi:Xaa-Pro aminopeptidase
MWSPRFLKEHREVAVLLDKIKDEAFTFISQNQNCTEYDVQRFILRRFDGNGLMPDYNPPMVAFNENSALVHYYPKRESAKKLEINTLILIDLWAKFKNKKRSPFADITWLAFYGRPVPNEVKETFEIVKTARTYGLNFIRGFLKRKEIPRGADIFWAIKKYFTEKGYEKEFPNFVGHSLGFFLSCHGRKRELSPNSRKEIYINQGYTLEPELDLKGKFGIRSEINFYIDSHYRLIITTKPQKEMVWLK